MALSEALSKILVVPSVKQARITVCGTCDKKHQSLPVCMECKCIIPAKASLKDGNCPLKKWNE